VQSSAASRPPVASQTGRTGQPPTATSGAIFW
jgi:hypothetical protein